MSFQPSLKHESKKKKKKKSLLTSGKAPRSDDAISAEIYKARVPPFAEKLTIILHYVDERSHPSKFKEAINPPIQTEKEFLSP